MGSCKNRSDIEPLARSIERIGPTNPRNLLPRLGKYRHGLDVLHFASRYIEHIFLDPIHDLILVRLRGKVVCFVTDSVATQYSAQSSLLPCAVEAKIGNPRSKD